MESAIKEEVAQESTLQEKKEEPELTIAQRAKIERNRQRALLLRQARIASAPYIVNADRHCKSMPREVDTGAGFFLEEDEEKLAKVEVDIKHLPGPVVGEDKLICDGCGKEFMDSYLHTHFDFPVCDLCRQDEEKYGLITKTDAKNKFLLKDVDFDRREPSLKFIIRRNPHNSHWGDMKLFLHPQVYKRAMEVWGSEEELEAAREKRDDNRQKSKQKKFDKRVKELRRAVRSSLYKKDLSAHQHEYGGETYDEEEDTYSKTCKTCGHVLTYEKM